MDWRRLGSSSTRWCKLARWHKFKVGDRVYHSGKQEQYYKNERLKPGIYTVVLIIDMNMMKLEGHPDIEFGQFAFELYTGIPKNARYILNGVIQYGGSFGQK